ncbi:MAG TPA: hypothetical protein VFQ05_06865 [Candidatus Eisenbacteria bacterium]|nr:hypothetical protein [Candidatus Eisenbacteria bacterium]
MNATPRVILVTAWLLLAGCATGKDRIAFRSEEGSRPLVGENRIFLLPESHVPDGARGWGEFVGDTLVVYRPAPEIGTERAYYERKSYPLRTSGISIGSYTLRDGRQVSFKGTMHRSDDRVIFRSTPSRGMEKKATSQEVAFAIHEVRSVDLVTAEAATGNMAIALLIMGAIATAAVVLTVLGAGFWML